MDIRDILNATGSRLIRGNMNTPIKGISTDSRVIREGEVFLALKGKVFDGHNFIPEAIRKGARVLVLEAEWVKAEGIETFKLPIVVVDDTLSALGEIAAFHRNLFHIPTVAITGSNGKTTTKEMAVNVLKRTCRVLSSKGTENNAIGVPLTLLRINHFHQVVILELGMNHRGEISKLADIARPSIGVITNIGPSHLEFLKTLAGVAAAKCELLNSIDGNGTAILNGDDARLMFHAAAFKMNKITFGFGEGCHIRGRDLRHREGGFDFVVDELGEFRLNMEGRHNIYNALATIALARSLKIEVEEIRNGLAAFTPLPLRMEEISIGDIKIIRDCYNANPQSMQSALAALKEMAPPGRKIVVCGDMLELGESAREYHRRVGEYIAALGFDVLITVGELSQEVAAAAWENGMDEESIFTCSSTGEAGEKLARTVKFGDLVLIKGSREIGMERISECFITSSIH